MYLCLTNQKKKKMLTLNQKQLKKIMDISAIAGRLDELNKLEGYVPSATISRRKGILKKQLANLVGTEKKEEDTVINIRIDTNALEGKVAKKEQSFATTIKNVLAGKFNEVENEDDDDTLVVLKSFLPVESHSVLGKVVREL